MLLEQSLSHRRLLSSGQKEHDWCPEALATATVIINKGVTAAHRISAARQNILVGPGHPSLYSRNRSGQTSFPQPTYPLPLPPS